MAENNPPVISTNEKTVLNERHLSRFLNSQDNGILGNSNTNDSCLVNCNIANDFLNSYSSSFRKVSLSNATLEQALIFFDFPDLLKDLDQDLELVQKEVKKKEDHEIYFNQNVNDKFRRLSTKYHPDRVKNKGGAEEDIERATEMQKLLNSVWGILKMLHGNFIDDSYLSDQNFKYSTCSAVEISILSHEERLKNLNNKILIELCWLSRIKHEKMIPNINKFLKLSYSCIRSFVAQNDSSFRQKRKRAMIHFVWFYSGYIELFSALTKLKEDCEKDTELAYIKLSVQRMLEESLENLKILHDMRTRYRHDYVKDFHRYMYENADRYFILPFVVHLDLLFKCSEVNSKRIEIQESNRMDKIGLYQQIRKVILKREHYEDVANFNNPIQTTRKSELSDFIRKINDITALYALFYHMTKYYCLGEETIICLLRNIYKIHINMDEEIAYTAFIEIVKQYIELIKQEFQPIKVISESDFREFKKYIDKAVNEFQTNMRETALKGLQEIKEAQSRIREEFAQMETRFETEFLDTREENTRRIKEMEEEIKDGNEIGKQILESLRNEILQRAKLEEQIKRKMELDSKVEEQKLRQQTEFVEKESEERISKKFDEIMNMKAQLEEVLKQEEFVIEYDK